MVMPFRLADVMMEEQVLCAVGFPAKHGWLAHVLLHCQHVGLRNHHPKKSWRVNVGGGG
jgi:hypothetical protein